MLLNPCIRRLRELKGWSAYRLAKEAGISRSYLASIEQGGNLSLQTFAKVLDALEVQAAFLTRQAGGFRVVLEQSSFNPSTVRAFRSAKGYRGSKPGSRKKRRAKPA